MRNVRLDPYERPAIVRRDRIEGLLFDTSKSDTKQPPAPSDVNLKANIRPVAWRGETAPYTKPEITDRTTISGLLTVSKSNRKDVGGSDVRVKDNIVPVRW
jgi:hypothetical protein